MNEGTFERTGIVRIAIFFAIAGILFACFDLYTAFTTDAWDSFTLTDLFTWFSVDMSNWADWIKTVVNLPMSVLCIILAVLLLFI